MTREEIDALVEAMPKGALAAIDGGYYVDFGEGYITTSDVRRTLYLAAGLNADGSEKAKGVRAVLYFTQANEFGWHEINGTWNGTTFTPDAEGV